MGKTQKGKLMKNKSTLLITNGLLLASMLTSCVSSGTGNAIDAKVDDLAENAYVYRGQQSSTEVMFYSAVIYTLRDQAREYIGKDKFGIQKGDSEDVMLKKLHDGNAVWGVMSSTSSAGYVYPTYYLYQHGYTLGFKTRQEYNALSDADKAKAMISIYQGTYPDGVDSLMTGSIDVTCGFMDTRYGSAYVQSGGKYEKRDELFTNTYTVAITDPIMNDTVSIRASLSDAKRAAIAKAFKAAVKDGSTSEENTAAWLVYQIYSHTGYVDAKDSDYDSAKNMYKWSEGQKGNDITIPTNVTYDSKDTTDADNKIRIQLVPSNDASTLESRAKLLAPLLSSYVNNEFEFEITVAASSSGYELTTQSLVAGQIDAAFLPAASYASAFISNPGKIDVLLSAARAGYKVQADDFAGSSSSEMFDEAHKILQRKAMNGEVDAKGNDIA